LAVTFRKEQYNCAGIVTEEYLRKFYQITDREHKVYEEF